MKTKDCIELAREVVRLGTEYPNAVSRPYYVGNFPVPNGPPLNTGGCIFGQAIDKLYPDFSLHAVEGRSIENIVLQWDWTNNDGDLVSAMISTQKNQDGKQPWGEAIKPLKDWTISKFGRLKYSQ